jgi:N-carbamoyl-D-amino-acid hydrolase
MGRVVTVGAAQLGPIARSDTRKATARRLTELMRQAHGHQCDLVVFPEAALTAFFPHWWMDDQTDIDSYFEREMPGPETRALFGEAAALGIGFYLGYAEIDAEGESKRHYNTSILVDQRGQIIGKYRKIHLPGHREHEPWRPFQNLEKRYFDVGNLGFPVWRAFGGVMGMCICNDRRWPETYRVMGLQGVEMIMLGYNTPTHNPAAPDHDRLTLFHHHLSMQAGAYQNGTWVIGVAKCGTEEGVSQIGQSAIIAPSGEMVAMSSTLGDELVVSRCDLDVCQSYKEKIWDFPTNRQPEHYTMISQRAAASTCPSHPGHLVRL